MGWDKNEDEVFVLAKEKVCKDIGFSPKQLSLHGAIMVYKAKHLCNWNSKYIVMKNLKHLILNSLFLAIIIMAYFWEALAKTIAYFLPYLFGGFHFGAIVGVIGIALILLASFLEGNHFGDR